MIIRVYLDCAVISGTYCNIDGKKRALPWTPGPARPPEPLPGPPGMAPQCRRRTRPRLQMNDAILLQMPVSAARGSIIRVSS